MKKLMITSLMFFSASVMAADCTKEQAKASVEKICKII